MADGVVTFLFTDVEGSTRRWEDDPDGMSVELAAHDEILRGIIAGRGGEVFKHTGDGMCAVFASPRAAVEAAVYAQRALTLSVRMGMATGRAEHRDGDYFGKVLNRAARVTAAGHGGQILLDGATAASLDGVELLDLGLRRLRDIAQPTAVFQVAAHGLRREFPPLRSVDPTMINVRQPVGTILGRDQELTEVDRCLRRHPVVTLTGVGGVGKTTLALAAAVRAAGAFPGGVWLIELDAVHDSEAVPDAVAAVLGVSRQPGMTPAESVAVASAGRRRLLVLDNREHVLAAAAAFVETVLARSSSVTILATSREALRVRGEMLKPIAPLDVTDADAAGVSLFIDRARAVRPDFDADSEVADVVEICRRLDGIPLAIELAAARMMSLTAHEVRARLDNRFRLLTGGPSAPARHRTLLHAVQWSFGLLADDERAVLTACSVFAGGFDLDSASAVTEAVDEFGVIDHLDALVRKSLLSVDKSRRATRYRMLATIRDFAQRQLVSSGADHAVRTIHARYFAHRAGRMTELWDSASQRDTYTWLTDELPDLRAAFQWAAGHDDLDSAAGIAVCAGFLGGWIELHEPSTWAEALLALAHQVRHPRLVQLYVAASECYRTGRVDDALRFADAAVEAERTGDYDGALYDITTTALGGTYITAGHAQRWLALCRARPLPTGSAALFARGSLVMALLTSGQTDEAVAESAGLEVAAEDTDNPGAAAYALLAYGYACRDRLPLEAYEALLRGLGIAQRSGNRMTESYLAVNLSAVVDTHTPLARTLDLLALAINNFHEAGSYEHMVSPLGVLATRLVELDRHEGAATILGFATTAFSLVTFPEITRTIDRLRDELGAERYEALTRAGADMSYSDLARYALDQIEQVRALINARGCAESTPRAACQGSDTHARGETD
ncbi:ATP-binding protein [Mycolicibacterium litorale]|uniref:ATP-binding protein n=1 Tax=Mycolicibacterium litorale TaxID=758802 RepID=UPI003CEEA667